MAVKITQFENTKKKTGFNVDVDAKFVSLVQHGANQKAFKIIKNDKGGKMQEKFIQSVVLRKNVKLDDITSIKGLEYLAEVKDCDVKKTEDYSVFTQIDANKMKDLQLSKVEDKAFIIFGDLSEEVDVDQSKLLTLSKEQMEKIEKGEFPTPKAYEWNPSVSSMFFDSFDRELFAMVDIIEGTLRQANIPPATMKKTILGAISAFQSFMSMAIDSLNSNSSGDKVAKFEKVENVSKLLKNKFIDKNTQEKGGNQMFTFENKEDFEKAVDERMLEILKKAKEAEKEIEKETEVMKSEEKKKEEKKKEETSEKTSKEKNETSDESKISEILESLKVLGTRVEKMENAITTPPAGIKQDEEESDTKDKKEKTEKDDNPFKGFFTKDISKLVS